MGKIRLKTSLQKLVAQDKNAYVSRMVTFSRIPTDEVIQHASRASGIPEPIMGAAFTAIAIQVEELVLNGDVYRLNNPLEENLFAEMVVSKDKAKASITVMCPLCRPNSECIRIYPKGLDEKATYFVKEMNLTKTGGTLMNVGLIIWLPLGDFQTRTVTFKKV
mgnify:CR=1 FL=1